MLRLSGVDPLHPVPIGCPVAPTGPRLLVLLVLLLVAARVPVRVRSPIGGRGRGRVRGRRLKTAGHGHIPSAPSVVIRAGRPWRRRGPVAGQKVEERVGGLRRRWAEQVAKRQGRLGAVLGGAVAAEECAEARGRLLGSGRQGRRLLRRCRRHRRWRLWEIRRSIGLRKQRLGGFSGLEKRPEGFRREADVERAAVDDGRLARSCWDGADGGCGQRLQGRREEGQQGRGRQGREAGGLRWRRREGGEGRGGL